MLVFLVVGIASYWSSAHIALVSALQGARVAAASRDARQAFQDGADRVEQVVNELGSRLSSPTKITYQGDDVFVEVAVVVPSLLGLLPGSVRRHVIAPRERYVREADR